MISLHSPRVFCAADTASVCHFPVKQLLQCPAAPSLQLLPSMHSVTHSLLQAAKCVHSPTSTGREMLSWEGSTLFQSPLLQQ